MGLIMLSRKPEDPLHWSKRLKSFVIKTVSPCLRLILEVRRDRRKVCVCACGVVHNVNLITI